MLYITNCETFEKKHGRCPAKCLLAQGIAADAPSALPAVVVVHHLQYEEEAVAAAEEEEDEDESFGEGTVSRRSGRQRAGKGARLSVWDATKPLVSSHTQRRADFRTFTCVDTGQ